MIIETTRFGNLDIKETDIYELINGLLGFSETTKYVLLNHDEKTPFKWLQAVENPDLAFVVMEPFIFFPEYQFTLTDNEIRELELAKPEEVALLSILVVPEDVKKISANLKEPIVINHAKRKGKQIVLNNEQYPIKYYIFEEAKKCQGGL